MLNVEGGISFYFLAEYVSIADIRLVCVIIFHTELFKVTVCSFFFNFTIEYLNHVMGP